MNQLVVKLTFKTQQLQPNQTKSHVASKKNKKKTSHSLPSIGSLIQMNCHLQLKDKRLIKRKRKKNILKSITRPICQ